LQFSVLRQQRRALSELGDGLIERDRGPFALATRAGLVQNLDDTVEARSPVWNSGSWS
jgi:hypothetical protein